MSNRSLNFFFMEDFLKVVTICEVDWDNPAVFLFRCTFTSNKLRYVPIAKIQTRSIFNTFLNSIKLELRRRRHRYWRRMNYYFQIERTLLTFVLSIFFHKVSEGAVIKLDTNFDLKLKGLLNPPNCLVSIKQERHTLSHKKWGSSTKVTSKVQSVLDLPSNSTIKGSRFESIEFHPSPQW